MPTYLTQSRKAAGFSLVELMISMTIGLVILAGMATLFVKNSRAADEIEKANRQLESGRFALQTLAIDARNAGYYAEFDPTRIATPASLPDPCSTNVTTISEALPLVVQGVNNYAAGDLTCLADYNVKPGTDVLVIRRTETCVTGQGNCAPVSEGGVLFQASLCNNASELLSSNVEDHFDIGTNITSMTRHKRNCTTASGTGDDAAIYRLVTHIYFISTEDRSGDGLPTLKRAELLGTTLGFTVVPLAEGIENMQFEYGVDSTTDTDVAPNSFVASPSTTADWRNVTAIKMHLLARNVNPSQNHIDNKTYKLGADTTVSAPGDNYKRHVFQSMLALPNPSGRNLP